VIREYALQLRAKLEELGCPVPVVDDDEGTTTTTFARSRIVVSEDPDRDDAYGPPRGAQRNPRAYYSVQIPVRVSIYAQAPQSGALPFEHRRYARRIAGAVLSALHEIAVTRRNHILTPSGRRVTPEDLEGSERPRGALYELTFAIEAEVPAASTWSSVAAPTKTFESDTFESTTKVVLDPLAPDETAATGCGA